jgi:uncharacterized protein (TIGR02996 family)
MLASNITSRRRWVQSMIDEVALLLTLLDRPGDAEARLVYADWLEDTGQDDLAQWLRLYAALPGLAPGARRHCELRLRELWETHRKDWVDLGGTVLTWQSALLLFRRRLAEVIAWCSEREYQVLRTPELMPHLDRGASGVEALWRCRRDGQRCRLVHQLAQRRAAQLNKLDIFPEPGASGLASGRLLLFDPNEAIGERCAPLTSGGFIDAYLAPAWDTWLAYFDDGAEGHRRAHTHWEAEWIVQRKVEPVPYPSYLVAWVPPALVPAVDWDRAVNARASLEWAENVDCELSMRLRELGWFKPPDRVKVNVHHEKRIGFARRDPQDQRRPGNV